MGRYPAFPARNSQSWRIAPFVLLLSLTACDLFSPANRTIITETEGKEFTLIPGGVVVPFRVANAGWKTVHLLRCGSRLMAAVDREEVSGWSQYSGDACLAVEFLPPLALAPGEFAQSARWIGERGHYRLHPGVFMELGQQPDWSSTSNDFFVR